jgi:hypothetical protein
LGLVLVVLGLAFLLDNMRVLYIEDVLNLWPCALIALGLLRLWNRGFLSVWGQLLVAGGVLCLVGVMWNEAAIGVWWPALVVWAGLFVAMKAFFPKARARGWRDNQECGDADADSVTITRDAGEEQAR